MKDNEKMKLTFESENLAVPEVRTNGAGKANEEEDAEGIVYDNLAIPEIVIKHKKKDE